MQDRPFSLLRHNKAMLCASVKRTHLGFMGTVTVSNSQYRYTEPTRIHRTCRFDAMTDAEKLRAEMVDMNVTVRLPDELTITQSDRVPAVNGWTRVET